MTNQKKLEELAFNRLYSRFKLQLFFPNRMPITHYGQERFGCTVNQIYYGHIKQVTLNRERGLQDCIDRIAICERLYGPYKTALVYDRRNDTRLMDGTQQTGKEIRKYVMGNLVECDTFILSDNEKKIFTNVIFKEGKYFLQPITENILPENIDFKKVVATSIARSGSRQKSLVYLSPEL